MGSAAKLKESLKLLDIDEIIGKAKMHAAEAYSHAKEAYTLRDEFFKLIEQHDLDSGTKERLSLAAASLNAALGAAVAMANMSSRAADDSAQGLDYNLLAAKASSEPTISRPYESSVLKDEKAANLDAGEIEALDQATISEDAALIKPVEDDAVTAASFPATTAPESEQAKPVLLAARTESTKLDSRERSPHREAVARDTKILSCEEEVRLEEQGCEKATSLEKMEHLEAVREGLARLREDAPLEEVADAAVAAANIVAIATDPDQNNSALLAAKTASTKLDYGERLARRKAVREGLARGKIDLLREEERIRLEAQGKAEEEDAAPEAVADAAVAAANVAAGEIRARRDAVRAGLARAKIDLLREEEGRRLEEERKAEKEYKKKKREEENKMRDDKRKQKMVKNTKPKDKGKK